MPGHIREHIDIIKPTVHFANHIPVDTIQKRSFQRIGMPSTGTGPKTNGVKVTQAPSGDLDDCDEMITPDCLRALYTINYTPVATDKNSYGIGQCGWSLCQTPHFDTVIPSLQSSSLPKRSWLPTSICSSSELINYHDSV